MLNLDTYYHIYNHANGNENLFKESENYRYFLQQYEKHLSPVVDTLAYCLMPNHFHLVVKTKSEEAIKNLDGFQNQLNKPDLPGFENLEGLKSNLEGLISNYISKQFSNFFNSYSKAFNKKYNRRGSLFVKNFKRKPIHSDTYLTTAIIYVHNNPVHHGFTKLMKEWQWSSVHAPFDTNQQLVAVQELIQLFGSPSKFVEQHRQAETEKLNQLSADLET